jgi:DNA-binding transcriptional MocR family regulator
MTALTTSLPSLLISIPEGVLDLGWGHPSPDLHPTGALATASERVLGQQSAVPLQYGAVQGFGPLLEARPVSFRPRRLTETYRWTRPRFS